MVRLMKQIRTIGIIGAGAIGGWIAARLALGGRPPVLVARGRTLQAIRQHGLFLEEAGRCLRTEPEICEDPRDAGQQDLVILAVKGPALAEAAELVRPLIGPQSLVLPMLNGVPWWFMPGERLKSVDPEGRIGSALPAERVIGSVVHAACSRPEPNRIIVNQADRLILGEPRGGQSERVAALVTLFESVGIRAEETSDVRRAIWYKLWGNATLNPLSALTRSTTDRLIGDPAIQAFLIDAMEELAQVGAAIGCTIGQSGEDRMRVTERLGAFRTSMLQDLEAGRPLELDSLLGAPIEIARRAGIATPRLDLLHAMAGCLRDSTQS